MSVRIDRRRFLIVLAGTGAVAASSALHRTPARAAAAPPLSLGIVPAAPVRRGRRLVLTVRTDPHRRLAVRDSSGARWRQESDDGSLAVFSRWT